MNRRRHVLSALSAAGAGALLLLGIVVPQAQAEPVTPAPAAPFVAAPLKTEQGDLSLRVDPGANIDPVSGLIEVRGDGYPESVTTLLVAVCATNSPAPRELSACMGGRIPDANGSTAWAWVSRDGSESPQGGGVPATLSDEGSFSVRLDMNDDTLDCGSTPCSVYVKADPEVEGVPPLQLALGFNAAVPSAPTTSASTSSVTPPRTVEPLSIRATAAPGETQQVMFAGFAPEELVLVSLLAGDVPLTEVTSSVDGVVTAEFVVPDLPPGTQTIIARGQTSRTEGVARFEVLPVVISSSPTSSSPTSSPTSSSQTSSSPTSSATPTSSTVTSSPTSASSSSEPVAVAPTEPEESGTVWWPWLLVGLIVVLALVIGVVTWLRRKAALEAENAERDALLAEAAAAEIEREHEQRAHTAMDAPTTVLDTPAGYRADEFGLLAGRDDAENPPLLSGQAYHWPGDAEVPPTTALPTTALPTGATPDEQPPTQALETPSADTPVPPTGRRHRYRDDDEDEQPATSADAGPSTGVWTPDFDDEDDDPDPTPGRHGA